MIRVDNYRLQLFIAIDCEVTEWSEWSGCSASCGKGTESRSRLITQHPSVGKVHNIIF